MPMLSELALTAGLLHDLGKYKVEFQQYLHGYLKKGDPRTYHKQAGAAKAASVNNMPLGFAIFGHHGGMPDSAELKAVVKEELNQAYSSTIWTSASVDSSDIRGLLVPAFPIRNVTAHKFQADLFTRILFSCLVDADWSDTARHERVIVNREPPEPDPIPLDPANRLKRVLDHIAGKAAVCAEGNVKRIRAGVLEACLDAADLPPGLFALTVPTGGGKTLAALAFAIKHAAKHDLRRVIYVAPYTSILEQNIGVFRDALGVGKDAADLFEHYSLAEPPGDDDGDETKRESAARRAENWDAPVVVTTNVQFFESLFSNKPGRCRKLHNIARSVVILDECQTLPPDLVAPTCGMLKQLATDLGTTIVLCTATQPAFDHDSLRDDERLAARPIIPKELDLFADLKRVHVTWPKRNDAPLEWSAVAATMRAEPSALCVVNTKKAARAIYDELKKSDTAGVFHLSTGMCPQHRREKLEQIKQMLTVGEPCYLVSTQLIEAGVDVDFPFLMRELAPLESVIQAAGRCNREGKQKGYGRVVVFRSAAAVQEPKKYFPPDRWYRAGRDKVEQIIAANGDGPQIDDPIAIQDYFHRLYQSGDLDGHDIQDMRQKFQFRSVAEAYRLIADLTQPVVVSNWESHREEVESYITELKTRPRKSLFRRLARFQVNLFPHQLLTSAHLVAIGPSDVLVWTGKYDAEAGIVDEMADAFIV
jgi:CRISPR-associated endonuclease/helicase Cas3